MCARSCLAPCTVMSLGTPTRSRRYTRQAATSVRGNRSDNSNWRAPSLKTGVSVVDDDVDVVVSTGRSRARAMVRRVQSTAGITDDDDAAAVLSLSSRSLSSSRALGCDGIVA